MVATAEALMNCGFRVVYAYTESDEISLLFAQDENLFGRKLRKYNSTLAAEASARFSLLLGQVATFDCRISQLPSVEFVVDYFRWRNEDAARNALNAYCYWKLCAAERGAGLYWEAYEKRAVNPQTGEQVIAQRHRIKRDFDLPMKDGYSEFIRSCASRT